MIDLDAAPATVYREVAALDDEAFAALMAAQDSRDKVIDALVRHFAGRARPEQIRGVQAVIHIKLWDRPDGGYDHREIVIEHGSCTVSARPARKPRLTLKVRPEDLRAIVTGRAGPKRLALRGRLRVIGDLAFGMKLTDLFDLSA